MKLHDFVRQLSRAGRWVATVGLGLLAIALVWHGGVNTSALAAPAPQWIIAADIDDQIENQTGQAARGTKNFIEDTAETVKEAARKNADRVDEATDGNNLFERKAQRDAGRIQERANQDASRTKSAVEKTKNFVQDAVDNIQDTFD